MIRIAMALLLSLLLTGCAGKVIQLEFYPPDQNTQYNIEQSQQRMAHGPVRSVKCKKGISQIDLDHIFDISFSVF